MQASQDKLLQRLEDIIGALKKKGADAADAVCIQSVSEDMSVRNQKLETAERSEHRTIGLRVIVEGRQATASFSDDQNWDINNISEDIMTRARSLPIDPYAIIPHNSRKIDKELALYDQQILSTDQLKEEALALENIALSHQGIEQSLGAACSQGSHQIALANSFGFSGYYRRSSFSKSVSVLAGKGTSMERDYAYDQKLFWEDIKDNQHIADKAAQRTLARLNPQIPKTGKTKIVFAPRIARRIIANLAAAINGASIVQKSSFLLNKMNELVLPPHLSLIDNPLLERGLASRSFDAEGNISQINKFIKNGRLESWILDERTALELNLKTTASASRSATSLPSPSVSNLALVGGDIPCDELMMQNAGGIYITGVMGMGVNLITGDYSQGANGFYIDEKGQPVKALNNFTIAGNLSNMLNNLQAGDDINMSHNIAAPTLAVGALTVAGQ